MPRLVLLFVSLLVTFGCDPKTQPVDCACTTEFVTVSFAIVDDTQTPIPGIAVESHVQRTGEVLQIDQFNAPQGVYFAVTDSQMNRIRTTGETIVVEGALGQRSFSETFVVNVPGECACHIAKVSGPETIVIDRGTP